MKTNKGLMLLSVLLFYILSACVKDDDYNIPNVEFEEPDITTNTTISIVKSMHSYDLVDFNEASNDGELILSGYVVSNDEAGNFYKTIIIQDAPENPTAAIQIDIDVSSLFGEYKPGRKVYVKLNGLGLDKLNGVLHIGAVSGTTVGRILASEYKKHIIRSNEIVPIVPLVITPSQFQNDYINMLVQLNDMQLNDNEVGESYANPNNTYSVNRVLKNCEDDSEAILRNSGYSDFKNQLFPTGNGSIVAVFSKYNSTFQLFVRDTDDVSFEEERCE